MPYLKLNLQIGTGHEQMNWTGHEQMNLDRSRPVPTV
jgi:hypothetical protein